VASKVAGAFSSDPARSHVSVIDRIGEREVAKNTTEQA